MSDGVLAQIVVGVFLLMLGGICGWIVTRQAKHADDLALVQRALDVALNDIAHLKEKASTHTNHIDTLFEMKTMMATMGAEIKALSETMPSVMQVMSQMAGILVKRAQQSAA